MHPRVNIGAAVGEMQAKEDTPHECGLHHVPPKRSPALAPTQINIIKHKVGSHFEGGRLTHPGVESVGSRFPKMRCV